MFNYLDKSRYEVKTYIQTQAAKTLKAYWFWRTFLLFFEMVFWGPKHGKIQLLGNFNGIKNGCCQKTQQRPLNPVGLTRLT